MDYDYEYEINRYIASQFIKEPIKIEILIDSAERGDVESMIQLAEAYKKKEDYDKQIFWLRLAAQKYKNHEAMMLLGIELVKEGKETRAKEFFDELIQENDARGFYGYSFLYDNEDDKAQWYLKGSEGHCFNQYECLIELAKLELKRNAINTGCRLVKKALQEKETGEAYYLLAKFGDQTIPFENYLLKAIQLGYIQANYDLGKFYLSLERQTKVNKEIAKYFFAQGLFVGLNNCTYEICKIVIREADPMALRQIIKDYGGKKAELIKVFIDLRENDKDFEEVYDAYLTKDLNYNDNCS